MTLLYLDERTFQNYPRQVCLENQSSSRKSILKLGATNTRQMSTTGPMQDYLLLGSGQCTEKCNKCSALQILASSLYWPKHSQLIANVLFYREKLAPQWVAISRAMETVNNSIITAAERSLSFGTRAVAILAIKQSKVIGGGILCRIIRSF